MDGEEKHMIEIYNVTKTFDNIKAVDAVSVVIKENTVFGLIGTNGAGKSTFFLCCNGILLWSCWAVSDPGQHSG